MKKTTGMTTVTGSDVDSLSKSINGAMRDLYKRVNALSDSVNPSVSGRGNMEDNNNSIRFIEDKDGLYMEVKFKNGWARLPQSLETTTKRD